MTVESVNFRTKGEGNTAVDVDDDDGAADNDGDDDW